MRVTNSHIEHALAVLNRKLGNELTPYSKDENGRLTANIGNMHMGSAYGGYRLERMAGEAGGIQTYGGYGTKRELLDRINAMIDAIDLIGMSEE